MDGAHIQVRPLKVDSHAENHRSERGDEHKACVGRSTVRSLGE